MAIYCIGVLDVQQLTVAKTAAKPAEFVNNTRLRQMGVSENSGP